MKLYPNNMNKEDLYYYWLRLRDNPKRLLKILTSKNARGILLSMPFEKSLPAFLKKVANISQQEIDEYKKEISESGIVDEIKKNYFKIRKRHLLSIQKWHEVIYFIVRKTKPQVIIETGVFDGISSSFILLGLKNNDSGFLYSIDLPARKELFGSTNEMLISILPKDKNPGWIVSPNLKKRWKLLLGSSKKHLPTLLAKLKKIDIFIHDSMHTDEYMMWEYETSWKTLNKGGLLCSDDIHIGSSFWQFTKQVKKQNIHKSGFGIIAK